MDLQIKFLRKDQKQLSELFKADVDSYFIDFTNTYKNNLPGLDEITETFQNNFQDRFSTDFATDFSKDFATPSITMEFTFNKSNELKTLDSLHIRIVEKENSVVLEVGANNFNLVDELEYLTIKLLTNNRLQKSI